MKASLLGSPAKRPLGVRIEEWTVSLPSEKWKQCCLSLIAPHMPHSDFKSYLGTCFTVPLPISVTAMGIFGVEKQDCEKWPTSCLIHWGASLSHWAVWKLCWEQLCISDIPAAFPFCCSQLKSGVARICHLREHKPHKVLLTRGLEEPVYQRIMYMNEE